MRQVFPNPVDNIDVVEAYAADPRPAPDDRPWVLANMISSLDGGIDIDGVSGGLGGPGDKAVFGAIRAIPDVIVVASGTVIAENYRAPQTPPGIEVSRIARGQSARPQIAIVTGSLRIDPEHRIFDQEFRPAIITTESSPAAARHRLTEVADIIIAGHDHVDLRVAMAELRNRGARTVLLEGGPTLNDAFVAADLVDELCLSVSPTLIGGASSRIVNGPTASIHAMSLSRLVVDGSFVFGRWVRDRTTT